MAELLSYRKQHPETATVGPVCTRTAEAVGAKAEKKMERERLSDLDSAKRVGVLLPDRKMRGATLKAARRRLSESRMRENLTYGSRWQGMETRIWHGQLRHSQRKQRVNRLPGLSLRRYSLTLPGDPAGAGG